MNPKILYLAHDIKKPSGGVKVIYDHVAILREHGFDAYVVHNERGYRYPFAGVDVPVLWQDDGVKISSGDHLVAPENSPLAELAGMKGVNTHIFVQSFALLYQGASPEVWRNLSLAGVFCPSEYIAKMLQVDFGMSPEIIPNAVDPLFKPAAKKRMIAYMPRRLGSEAEFIIKHACSISDKMDDVQISPIHKMSLSEVAGILGEAAVFLSTSYLEGFGLPTLEAMASGCVAVGFKGFGGKEYCRSINGLWIPEGDVLAAARGLVKAVDMFDSGSPKLAGIVEQAGVMAAKYSIEAQSEALVRYWNNKIYS
ncbi:glycosyltransferase [Desulfovibrio sp. JC010]|uniref:glycosyltransferase n=1 Tax=Desulfovibrio sp. JC010 TaxID=2593641 RepID=UPI0013D4A74D|nr:glycosyltransferase [Desulfovibrio sp. JC010]NDV25317.1 glycosyltransferase family 4 protein [Desulfovibrio sp. JC010]